MRPIATVAKEPLETLNPGNNTALKTDSQGRVLTNTEQQFSSPTGANPIILEAPSGEAGLIAYFSSLVVTNPSNGQVVGPLFRGQGRIFELTIFKPNLEFFSLVPAEIQVVSLLVPGDVNSQIVLGGLVIEPWERSKKAAFTPYGIPCIGETYLSVYCGSNVNDRAGSPLGVINFGSILLVSR